MPPTPWPPPRTTARPPSWRRRASTSCYDLVPAASVDERHLRHLGRRRRGRRRRRPAAGQRAASPTASSCRAWRATPTRPATPPRPATAASTCSAPWPTPRPMRSSPPALPLSAAAARWWGRYTAQARQRPSTLPDMIWVGLDHRSDSGRRSRTHCCGGQNTDLDSDTATRPFQARAVLLSTCPTTSDGDVSGCPGERLGVCHLDWAQRARTFLVPGVRARIRPTRAT